jgi:prepilin-type N-terminal cleavage/methylation domain-containing protein
LPDEISSGDRGFTLIEVMVTAGLMTVIAGICLSFLLSAQTTEAQSQVRTAINDQIQLAVQQIDQEVRSGNLIYSPQDEASGLAGQPCTPASVPSDSCVASGYSLRVYTQANGANKCVQWRVYQTDLQSRSWNVDSSSATGWHTVADHIGNADVSGSAAPFSLDSTPSYGGRMLDINLVVSEGGGNTGQVQSSITGRNTEYGYPNTVCATVPSP